MEIIDYSAIPSTITLLRIEALTVEEQAAMAETQMALLEPKGKPEAKPDILDLKAHLEMKEKENEVEDCEKQIK